MKNFTKLAAACGLVLGLFASNSWADQKLALDQSSLGFTFKQMGVAVDGKFKKFDAQIKLDPAKWDKSSVSFTVDTGSAYLGVKETDAELVKPVWLSTVKFPQATFASTAIKSTAPGKLEVAGKLTIKGITTNVTVPVTLTQSGATTFAAGSLPIQRLAYKVGEGEWADTSMVADAVTVNFKIALTGLSKI